MLAKTLKTYPLSILCALGIVVLSLAPMPEVPQLADVPLFDKWVHFVMYGVLSLLIWWEMRRHITIRPSILWGLIASGLLGGLLELGQAYLTTCRSGEWMDFLADAIGALLGSILGLAIRHIWRRHKERTA